MTKPEHELLLPTVIPFERDTVRLDHCFFQVGSRLITATVLTTLKPDTDEDSCAIVLDEKTDGESPYRKDVRSRYPFSDALVEKLVTGHADSVSLNLGLFEALNDYNSSIVT